MIRDRDAEVDMGFSHAKTVKMRQRLHVLAAVYRDCEYRNVLMTDLSTR
jgi:hypothetical protein